MKVAMALMDGEFGFQGRTNHGGHETAMFVIPLPEGWKLVPGHMTPVLEDCGQLTIKVFKEK